MAAFGWHAADWRGAEQEDAVSVPRKVRSLPFAFASRACRAGLRGAEDPEEDAVESASDLAVRQRLLEFLYASVGDLGLRKVDNSEPV